MKSNSYLWYILLAAVFFSCGDDESTVETIRDGLDYLPLKIGTFREYDISTTEYSLDGTVVEETYQLRVEIAEKFQNQEGGETFVIHRQRREESNQEWGSDRVWSARYEEGAAIVIEENVPFVKLSLPVFEGAMWDGNALNTQQGDDYLLTDVARPFSLSDGTLFDNTLTVLQEDNNDYIVALDRRKEVYAKDIGLIFKESTQLDFCSTPECVFSPDTVINTGFIYKQQLFSHGKL